MQALEPEDLPTVRAWLTETAHMIDERFAGELRDAVKRRLDDRLPDYSQACTWSAGGRHAEARLASGSRAMSAPNKDACPAFHGRDIAGSGSPTGSRNGCHQLPSPSHTQLNRTA
jgi:hypothetical protein